jgi:hypothetical protein
MEISPPVKTKLTRTFPKFQPFMAALSRLSIIDQIAHLECPFLGKLFAGDKRGHPLVR